MKQLALYFFLLLISFDFLHADRLTIKELRSQEIQFAFNDFKQIHTYRRNLKHKRTKKIKHQITSHINDENIINETKDFDTVTIQITANKENKYLESKLPLEKLYKEYFINDTTNNNIDTDHDIPDITPDTPEIIDNTNRDDTTHDTNDIVDNINTDKDITDGDSSSIIENENRVPDIDTAINNDIQSDDDTSAEQTENFQNENISQETQEALKNPIRRNNISPWSRR